MSLVGMQNGANQQTLGRNGYLRFGRLDFILFHSHNRIIAPAISFCIIQSMLSNFHGDNLVVQHENFHFYLTLAKKGFAFSGQRAIFTSIIAFCTHFPHSTGIIITKCTILGSRYN